jgi:hypothetical protein
VKAPEIAMLFAADQVEIVPGWVAAFLGTAVVEELGDAQILRLQPGAALELIS